MTDLWFTDRTDPRTVAALSRKCPIPMCLAVAGEDCKTTAGIVHQLRVPEKDLFADHLPASKVRG